MRTMCSRSSERTVADLAPVSIVLFYPPSPCGVDTYLVPQGSAQPIHYSSATAPPNRAALDSLVASGVKTLSVPYSQLKEFRERMLEFCATSPDVTSDFRFEACKEKAKADLANAWRRSEVDPLVATASGLADGILDACLLHEGMTAHLLHLLHHDGNTFAHMSNVCVYAVLLANALGFSDRETLLEMGTAALLHDLGKRHVSPDVLRKPGPLTPAQRRIIADHPRTGFNDLRLHRALTWRQLMVVYQHHEREDGSGYPVGIPGAEIHWMAKVCAVVDVFDALTTRRAYRDTISTTEALAHLEEESRHKLDKESVKCWKALVERAASKSA